MAGLENKILEINQQLEAYGGIELDESIIKKAVEEIDEIRVLETRLQVLQSRKTALGNESRV